MGKYTAIDDPSAYFQTALYTGNNTANHAITNDGNSDLQPDWLWIKSRDAAHSHWVVDSNRGVNKGFFVDAADAEKTSLATRDVASFDTDGFTVGVPYQSSSTNSNASKKVAWQWKANAGTTASNTDGSKTATVQANQDAGFSIITYAGSGSASTVGHGLADTPDVIIFKNRSAANVWATYHQGLGNNLKLELNSTNAQDADGSFMNGTLPTSSVFTVGASVNTNGSGSNYVAYCFAAKQGYSKFGKYTGNGSSDGPFVYTGFKPAFVMIKRTDSTGGWTIYDTKRGYNGNNYELFPHSDEAEYTGTSFFEADILSNGFKLRLTDGQINASNGTYIYMAFAENPFVTSTGIMGTAR